MPLDIAFRWLDVDAIVRVSAMKWEGAKKICLWIMTLPLSVGILALAVAQFYALEWLGNAVADDRPVSRPESRP